MYIFVSLPLPNIYIRECSRNLPTILVIVILSVYPSIPALIQLIPLIIISTLTPLIDASTSFSIIVLSVRELILTPIYASSPFLALSISASIKLITLF